MEDAEEPLYKSVRDIALLRTTISMCFPYENYLMDDNHQHDVATFAAGCFWDAEALFRRADGVVATKVGFTGGSIPEPTYEQVSSGVTGHTEAVQVVFDPSCISYPDLLDIFWSLIDPLRVQDDRTRLIIFYHSPVQKEAAETSIKRHQGSSGQVAMVEILPAGEFWNAEECHQQYYEKCGQGYCTSMKYWE
jgi:methionine-S-sulfoxide reductase